MINLINAFVGFQIFVHYNMKEGQTLWTRNELLLAINLYCKIPFGQMYKGNEPVKELAKLIGRSPSAVARKLGNFASFDPTLQARGIKGLTNTSKLDKEIWDEFYNNWDAALLESEQMLAQVQNSTIEKINAIDIDYIPAEGKEKERLVKMRVNQSIFRRLVMATYNYQCCITGITQPELLIASHILPWSKDERNRLNPMNGLAMNALHDKAFEVGLITIDANSYRIKVSSVLKGKNIPPSIKQNFLDYHDKEILLPKKFLPDTNFLKVHNDSRFKT